MNIKAFSVSSQLWQWQLHLITNTFPRGEVAKTPLVLAHQHWSALKWVCYVLVGKTGRKEIDANQIRKLKLL